MTDFFAQLAARYRGEAGTLRPRVPFRFEPVSPSLAAAALTGPAAAGPAEAGPGRAPGADPGAGSWLKTQWPQIRTGPRRPQIRPGTVLAAGAVPGRGPGRRCRTGRVPPCWRPAPGVPPGRTRRLPGRFPPPPARPAMRHPEGPCCQARTRC